MGNYRVASLPRGKVQRNREKRSGIHADRPSLDFSVRVGNRKEGSEFSLSFSLAVRSGRKSGGCRDFCQTSLLRSAVF